MSNIELKEVYVIPERVKHEVEQIELLGDYDIRDVVSDENSESMLGELRSKTPSHVDLAESSGSFFSRTGYNILLAILMLTGGIFTVLFSQWLNYEKVADGKNLYVLLSWYMSQAMVGLLPSVDAEKDARFSRNKKAKKRLLKIIKGMCSIDIFCGILIMVGFFKVGASLFQIISALGIPLTAMIARIVIKRRQSVLQWIGIIVIVFGFFSNTIFPYMFAHQAAASNISTKETLAKQDVSLGILMTVSGLVLASGLGVGIEKVIHEPSSPTPSKICSYLGIYSTLLCCAVQLLFVVPFRYHGIYTVFSDALGISGLNASKEAWIYLFKFFGGFVLMTLVHVYQNYSSYILIEAWGVIPMGILSAARSVVIMLISSLLYCKSDSNQCFTSDKLTSAVIVTCGILFYNFASFKKASNKS